MQGELEEGLGREAGGEAGKGMGEEDNDERSSCGSFHKGEPPAPSPCKKTTEPNIK